MAAKETKGANLAARIPAELREAMEEEAARSGRTLSQVAVAWLEQARDAQLTRDKTAETSAVGEMLRRLVSFASDLKEAVGDPEGDSYARSALIHGWQALIAQTFPPTKPSPLAYAAALRHVELRAAAEAVLKALAPVAEKDPEGAILSALMEPGSKNIFADRLDRLSAADLLTELARGRGLEERGVQLLFDRLDKITVDLASELDAAGLSLVLAALYQARTRELEAMSADASHRVTALQKAAALVEARLQSQGAPEEQADAR